MATYNDTKELRKEPVQRRSQQLFDAVLGAAARILGSGKPEDLNTNRVAEIAGVSIGSIYQYFPGKTAIATALGKRVVRKTFETLAAEIDLYQSQPLSVIIEHLVDAFIALKFAELEMESVLVKEAFRIGFSEDLMAMDPEMIDLFVTRIRALSGKMRPGIDPELTGYILYQSLRATMIVGSLQRPDLIRGEPFRAEMIRLLHAYLAP